MTITGQISKACGTLVALAALALPAIAEETSTDPAATARVPAGVEGTWRTLTGTEINIRPCGDKFCGTFSYIVIPAKDAETCRNTPKDQFAALILDYQNPSKSMQSRPLLGAQAITLEKQGDKEVYNANIYNAQEGKSYDVRIWINGDTLTLGAGCFAGICAVTQDWPRVPDRGAPDFTCEGGQ